jgi:hypothetical protein
MCTVTYIPAAGGLLLTSSRDEHIDRGTALPPALHRTPAGMLIHPTDARAGGTWFIINARGSTGILLNGAHAAHTPQPPYRMSRGLLLRQLFESDDIRQAIMECELEDIEPFTLVLCEQESLLVFRWNGNTLQPEWCDPRQSHIWSSATLYNPQMQEERQQWFAQWRAACPAPSMEDIIGFHAHTISGNNEYGIRMKRPNGIQSMSITSACISRQVLQVNHLDLTVGITHTLEVPLPFAHLSPTPDADAAQLLATN